MKKFLSLVLSFLIGVGACAIASTGFSHAASDDKTYLINPTFASETDYQTAYNIDDSEVCSNFTPTSATGVLPGASVKPVTTATDNSFDKTYIVKTPVNKTAEQSLFMFLFWNQSDVHDLKVIASDGTNTLEWNINALTITSQLNSKTETSKIRYGWVTVEFPSNATMTISSLRVVYQSDTSDDSLIYSNMYFYAPYVAAKQNDNITFSQKQKFYNYSVKFSNYDYVNEKLGIFSANDLFEYCYIGDINYLAEPTDDFYFIISVTNNNAGAKVAHTLKIGTYDFEYTFADESNYEVSVELYNSVGRALWVTSRSYNIREFVAVYLDHGLPDMEKGQTFSYEINISLLLLDSHDLSVRTSSSKVASAEIKDGKLYITANGRGSCDVILSVVGHKGTETEKTYSATYKVYVSEKALVNWWLIGGVAIFLIVAVALVYTIMVKRRMIKGKYPKY